MLALASATVADLPLMIGKLSLVLLDIHPQSASELEEHGRSFVSVLQGEIVGKLNYSLVPANTQR